MSPEQKTAQLERLKKLWDDPEFREKISKRVIEANTGRRQSEATRRKRSESLKASHKKRIAMGRTCLPLTEEQKEKRRKVLERNRFNKDIEEKRKIRAEKARSVALYKIRVMLNLQQMHERKRGFKVPAKLFKDYQRLMKTKKYRAKEAARMLGIIE